MIRLEVFGPTAAMDSLARWLERLGGVSRVTLAPAHRADHSLLGAALSPASVDPVREELHRLGIADADVTLSRQEVIGRRVAEAAGALVWTDLLGQAWINARPVGRYLTFMLVAGVIAGYGVLDANVILIVGAMAVSPDLLPITAMAVGILGSRWRLLGGAMLTLCVGLGVAAGAAAILTFALNQVSELPSGFTLSGSAAELGGLTTIGIETITVAFAAGAAGMLALETRVSSAVGVAISVTTIPAAAYLGSPPASASSARRWEPSGSSRPTS
ncbi:MAG: DUF389 domain-containing protein [Solirubrobacterales bacterium]